MTTDISQTEPGVPHPKWKMPRVLEIRISRVPYQAPKLRHFKSAYARYHEAIEFLVKTDGPLPPVTALTPVLYVGETAVIGCCAVGENVYRFLAFELDALEEGAPISLGWPDQPAEARQQTKFRYELKYSPKQE
jgi:hypothetical protein